MLGSHLPMPSLTALNSAVSRARLMPMAICVHRLRSGRKNSLSMAAKRIYTEGIHSALLTQYIHDRRAPQRAPKASRTQW